MGATGVRGPGGGAAADRGAAAGGGVSASCWAPGDGRPAGHGRPAGRARRSRACGAGLTIVLALAGALLALAPAALVAACGGSSGGSSSGGASASASPSGERAVTEQQVMDLVDLTAAAIEGDAPATLTAIDNGEAPYVDAADPALYTFVLDPNVRMVAHPDPAVQGRSMKGVPDAAGKLVRDEMVALALAGDSGWIDYVREEPGEAGLQQKSSYFQLVEGSDGQQYVVGAGRYLGPWTGASPDPASQLRMMGNPNMAFVEPAGQEATGFSVDLADEIAGRIGRRLDVTFEQFPDLFPMLDAGACDIAMSAISITPERRKEVDFSTPYFDSGQSLLVVKDSGISGTGDLKGKAVGALEDSTNQATAEGIAGVGRVVTFPDKEQMFDALLAGKVDAVVCDTPFALYNAKLTGQTEVAEALTTGDKYGIAVKKGNAELLAAIDDALAAIKADGTYDRLYAEYFGS
jgi:polar amino acid transport system substrate-binding protein